MATNHLSRLEDPKKESLSDKDIDDKFPNESLYRFDTVRDKDPLWFANFANYLVVSTLPKWFMYQQRKKFFADLKHYVWYDPFLIRICANQIIGRCVPCYEGWHILVHCHSGPAGRHFNANRIAGKVLKLSFYWPTIF